MVDKYGPLPRQYTPHPSGLERFSPLPKKYRNMARAPVNFSSTEFEIMGMNVLYEHFLAAAAILDATAPQMMNVVGDIGVEEARRRVPFDTGATFDSISIKGGSSGFGAMPRMANEVQYFVEIGPETFYAPFLEYGTIYMTPRPFMMPAADLMEATLAAAVKAIIFAVIEGEGGGLGGSSLAMPVLSDPRVKNPFADLRTYLYSAAKLLGDVSVIGGRPLLGGLRASMYSMARGLGDVGSVMNGTLANRVQHRLQGRVTGRIIGFGSASLSFGRTYSAFPGGSGGHRIYQRIAGSHTKSFGVSAYGSSFVNRLFP